MITTLAVANYRSLRNVVAPLSALNLVSGENGSGKSSLYRALRLLADTAQGGVVGSLAREGGLSSTLWAGPENISRAMRKGEQPVQGGPRREPVNLRLGFADEELSYCIDLGLPPPANPPFSSIRKSSANAFGRARAFDPLRFSSTDGDPSSAYEGQMASGPS